MTPGLLTAVFAMGLLFGGLLLERALLWLRWGPYFWLTLPLGRGLAPVPRAPSGSGSTSTVDWMVAPGGDVRWWGTSSKAPMGLHGRVRVGGMFGSHSLEIRWAPPWTMWIAAVWLIGLGLVRGEGRLTVPIGAMMILGIGLVYWRAAAVAGRELRADWTGVGPPK